MIRLVEVRLAEGTQKLVSEVLDSGHLVQGPLVRRFESEVCDLTGTDHAVAVSSGTVALVAALEALGIGPGDEVVSTPWTFAATLNAILERGARARLVDIRPDDFTLDVDALLSAVGPSTTAVLPVHLYGQPADMPAILGLAQRRDLAVIEDAAQAHGAAIHGQAVGSLGTAGCFSFYATKNVTTGEGGVVTTNDGNVADRLRTLRNQGMRQRYGYEMPGHNYRMTDICAAIGVAEMGELAARTERRRANAARLTEGLAGIPGLTTPGEQPGRRHVFHQYTVRIGAGARLGRDALIDELTVRGIEAAAYYPQALHDYACYRDHPRVVTEPVPQTEQAAREVLSLPVHPWLTEPDLDQIVTTVRELLG